MPSDWTGSTLSFALRVSLTPQRLRARCKGLTEVCNKDGSCLLQGTSALDEVKTTPYKVRTLEYLNVFKNP